MLRIVAGRTEAARPSAAVTSLFAEEAATEGDNSRQYVKELATIACSVPPKIG